jgi:Fe2+ or Zn2+ uptake regulation protein
MTATTTLERSLHRNGFRLTSPRRAVLHAVETLGDHFTPEAVISAAPQVGRATIFRTLRLLQQLDVICQVVLDNNTLAYRLGSHGHHHHIVCSTCSRVTDFASCDVQDLLDELARRTGYEIEAHRLEVYGRCAECRRPANDG